MGTIERKFGSSLTFVLLLFGVMTTSSFHLFFALVFNCFGFEGMMFSQSVGFSGVIFMFAVLEAYTDTSTSTRSILGKLIKLKFVVLKAFLFWEYHI